MANMLDYNIVVSKVIVPLMCWSEFKLQFCYSVLFWTNTLEKVMNTLILPAMG